MFYDMRRFLCESGGSGDAISSNIDQNRPYERNRRDEAQKRRQGRRVFETMKPPPSPPREGGLECFAKHKKLTKWR